MNKKKMNMVNRIIILLRIVIITIMKAVLWRKLKKILIKNNLLRKRIDLRMMMINLKINSSWCRNQNLKVHRKRLLNQIHLKAERAKRI